MSIICPGHSCHKSLNIKNFKELATHQEEICETLFDAIGNNNKSPPLQVITCAARNDVVKARATF